MSVLVSGCSTGSDKKADTIKIGVVAELTGNNATYGTSITNGIKLAVQQLNDTGGLLGKKLNWSLPIINLNLQKLLMQ